MEKLKIHNNKNNQQGMSSPGKKCSPANPLPPFLFLLFSKQAEDSASIRIEL
jgi:hypothetical protein